MASHMASHMANNKWPPGVCAEYAPPYVALWRGSTGITDLTGDPLFGGADYLDSDGGDVVYWWFRTRS
jgi:hypothetical protein